MQHPVTKKGNLSRRNKKNNEKKKKEHRNSSKFKPNLRPILLNSQFSFRLRDHPQKSDL